VQVSGLLLDWKKPAAQALQLVPVVDVSPVGQLLQAAVPPAE
jgi:hypothetical protein